MENFGVTPDGCSTCRRSPAEQQPTNVPRRAEHRGSRPPHFSSRVRIARGICSTGQEEIKQPKRRAALHGERRARFELSEAARA